MLIILLSEQTVLIDELQCHRTCYLNTLCPACRNLGNYIHNTSHRAELMALICDMFDKIAVPFIKFKDLKMFH
jgi:hypothetical protein